MKVPTPSSGLRVPVKTKRTLTKSSDSITSVSCALVRPEQNPYSILISLTVILLPISTFFFFFGIVSLGDPATDLPLQHEGTDSDEDSDLDSDSDSDDDMHPLSRISSTTSASATDIVSSSAIHSLQAAAAASEFQAEVTQSLDRAFAEGHSVDNASVELKTLRMASNVPLRKIREAIVAAIVERIEVETVEVLQVCFSFFLSSDFCTVSFKK